MPRPRRLNLLVIGADRRRVVRLSLRRRSVWMALGGVTLAAIGATFLLGAVSGGSLALRRERASAASLFSRLAEQQALIDRYRRGMTLVGTEIETWRELHAKILEPFGPEAGAEKRTAGMGGRAGPAATEARQRSDEVGAELARLSRSVAEEGENLRSLERFLSRASRVLASLPSRWPLRGPVNSDFGSRRSPWGPSVEFHGGIDIGASVGTPVLAPAPGLVVFAGRQPEFGIALLIDHGHDTTSLYGHLSRLNVSAGQTVERGEVLAWSGNTGRSSGPHLHYEIQVKGQPVNPHTYLWE
jgi:murein DD-endopeptidase MepM/ murein hydrolase activator NlpD